MGGLKSASKCLAETEICLLPGESQKHQESRRKLVKLERLTSVCEVIVTDVVEGKGSFISANMTLPTLFTFTVLN